MPGPNHVVLASGAAVAASVVIAAAIAVYESPELRRYADDVRRRIAIALQSLGDDINPTHREPLFNRPEDAEGFMQSSRGEGAQPGVDADEESRRRQREELLYWNSVMLAKQQENEEVNEKNDEKARPAGKRGSSFDDFLKKDEAGEAGSYVYNSAVDAKGNTEGLRHRGDQSGFSSIYANPFADEHGISHDEFDEKAEATPMPAPSDDMSDIYSVTTAPEEAAGTKTPTTTEAVPPLVDLSDDTFACPTSEASSVTIDREAPADDFLAASESSQTEAYQSIQAWARDSNAAIFSPMPQSPETSQMSMSTSTAPEVLAVPDASDVESLSDGQLTPTDSMSIVDAADFQSRDGHDTRPWEEVISESDGMKTPASWSEVGSQISESDHADQTQQRVPA